MQLDDYKGLIEIVLGLFAVVGAIAGFAWKFGGAMLASWRKWRDRVGAALDGLAAVPALRETVEGISMHVRPNGGGSLYDGVQRTEIAVAGLAELIEAIIGTMQAEDDADETSARFDCDAEGGFTSVSATLCSWLGCLREELLGWNWQNSVHPADQTRVNTLLKTCREQQRDYRNVHRWVTKTGDVIWLRVLARPVPNGPPSRRWIGIMHRVEAPVLAATCAVDEE